MRNESPMCRGRYWRASAASCRPTSRGLPTSTRSPASSSVISRRALLSSPPCRSLAAWASCAGSRPSRAWVTGGASPSTVPGLVAAGARHVVVVRWLTEASDPGAAARALRDALDGELAVAGGR